MSNIYDFIDEMKQRPGMFTQVGSLGPLETLLFGYCACLHANEIKEPYEGRVFNPSEFSDWLFDEMGWSGAFGFARAIEENAHGSDTAFDTFFKLVQRFRQSRTEPLAC
ncbi:hypothetical protein [Pseudosulfitobacter sp. SM2401]|uniref:hypothetical protein n=1 Tax=Pseudosulfitobacter sp. SM2401 TaxID=3350098 RepID=UPI0036F2575F